jgi:ubiquinone/menaquinone biosynthesis C-methylase UbiE
MAAAAFAADSERFAARYRLAGLDVMKVTELAATGSDYGASGYTTMAQVEELVRRLRLELDDVVLDLGSGTGWPGLHLVKLTGCSVVVSDPVGEGAQVALARAESEDIAGRAWAVPADGRALPFASASFDAVVHSDALC